LIATNDFFGTVAASWFVSVRRVALRTIELELGARVLDYRFAQNAIVTRTETSVGPIFAAVTQTFQTKWFGLPAAWAPSMRIDVPRTDTGYEITTFAATPALLATLGPSDRFRLHARLAALLFSASPPSGVDSQFAGALSFDSTYRPTWWFATSLGMEAQSGWHGPFDHLLLRGTLRFALGRNNRLDIAAAVPMLGEERTTLLFQLGFSRAM
jgi:hypothetical protein